MEELLEQIKVVAEARKEMDRYQVAKNLEMEKWERINKTLLDGLVVTREEVAKSEAKLRVLTLLAYAATGDKAPAPGVGIRERVVLTYDGKVAFDWAKAHKMALQLDKRAFEKIAKADTPDFVKVSTEAIATIATELKVE